MAEDEGQGTAGRRVGGRIRELERGAQRPAGRCDEARARFLAAAGHDLRQPLQTLGILADILRRRIADPESRALVERQQAALWSLRELLECFLDLNRLDCGAMVPAERPFSVREVLDGVREEFQDQAQRRGITLRIVSSSAVVSTDPLLLRRIVEVLVANAMHYAGARRITVGCRRRGARLRLEVWDTGDALAPERIAAVLKDPLPGGGAGAPGFGPGLSVVRRFADLLGLGLDMGGVAGRCTAFALVLPRTNEGRPPAAGAVPASGSTPAAGGDRGSSPDAEGAGQPKARPARTVRASIRPAARRGSREARGPLRAREPGINITGIDIMGGPAAAPPAPREAVRAGTEALSLVNTWHG